MRVKCSKCKRITDHVYGDLGLCLDCCRENFEGSFEAFALLHRETFYVVYVEKEPCALCGAHGGLWGVVNLRTDTALSTSWGDKEYAEEICELLNDAARHGYDVCDKDCKS